MSVTLKNVSLSIQRSIKVEDFKYNKIEIGMVVDVRDEQPLKVINKLYAYIDAHVDRLLTLESAVVKRNSQAVADKFIDTGFDREDKIPV